MILKPPIYVFFHSKINPLESKVVSIVPNKDNSGNLLIFADPLRKYIFPLWKVILRDNIRLLETEKFGEKNYIIFPLNIRFEKDEFGVSSSYQIRTIWVPLTGRNIQLDLQLENHKHGAITFGIGYGTIALIKHSYLASSLLPPWRAILTEDNPSIKELQYASILDNAITTSVSGNISIL